VDWDRLGEPCPLSVGTRIELLSMVDDPDPIPVGTQGIVKGGNGAQLWVTWDNGRNLSLVIGVDRWKRVP